MKRRLIIIGLIATSLLGGASAARALGTTPSAGGYWGCVGSETLNVGYCLSNPLPERLPLPI